MLGVGIALEPLARTRPQLVRVLPEVALPVLPLWLTAHRELRGTRRFERAFGVLARELAA